MALHILLTAAALSAQAFLPARAAGRPDWELLGSRRVNFAAERDLIDVGAREGRFTALKLEVEGGNIEMYDVRVTFGDGQTWSPATRIVFREGSWSRTIDLPGRARVIRRIEFRYRSQLRRGRGTVQVYGRSVAEPPPAPVPPPAALHWDRLGSRQVSFAAERDVVEIGAREGRFTALKLEVEGGNIEMYDVRVTFGDGETWSPATRFVFREGSWSRTIDLPGRARVIRRVEFRYRSQIRRGRAVVHVYGRGGPARSS